SAADTAPHFSCPSTTTILGDLRCSIAYSMLPMASSVAAFPATRTTNRSPIRSSNAISGGTRESAQVNTTPKGFCESLVHARRHASARGLSFPETNRAFPASSSAHGFAGARLGHCEHPTCEKDGATVIAAVAKITDRILINAHDSACTMFVDETPCLRISANRRLNFRPGRRRFQNWRRRITTGIDFQGRTRLLGGGPAP